MARKQELEHFVEQPRRGNPFQQRRELANRGAGGGIERQAELGAQAHGAQHPDGIFPKARLGITDDPQHALSQVCQPAVVIDDILRRRIVVKGVDREIPPPRVRSGPGAERGL